MNWTPRPLGPDIVHSVPVVEVHIDLLPRVSIKTAEQACDSTHQMLKPQRWDSSPNDGEQLIK